MPRSTGAQKVPRSFYALEKNDGRKKTLQNLLCSAMLLVYFFVENFKKRSCFVFIFCFFLDCLAV